jgi:hypothetical protein
MKTVLLAVVMSTCLAVNVHGQTMPHGSPRIGLFESIETIKGFLKDGAKQDYSDKYLSGITLHYFDGHPRKGLAWVYAFSFTSPRLGGDVNVYHFMDGEIIEFRHGP